jgi:hypothetical protein
MVIVFMEHVHKMVGVSLSLTVCAADVHPKSCDFDRTCGRLVFFSRLTLVMV